MQLQRKRSLGAIIKSSTMWEKLESLNLYEASHCLHLGSLRPLRTHRTHNESSSTKLRPKVRPNLHLVLANAIMELRPTRYFSAKFIGGSLHSCFFLKALLINDRCNDYLVGLSKVSFPSESTLHRQKRASTMPMRLRRRLQASLAF
jgi:hypothetical protein